MMLMMGCGVRTRRREGERRTMQRAGGQTNKKKAGEQDKRTGGRACACVRSRCIQHIPFEGFHEKQHKDGLLGAIIVVVVVVGAHKRFDVSKRNYSIMTLRVS